MRTALVKVVKYLRRKSYDDKICCLGCLFLCFMPASKIEHTEALFTFAKKPKQEPSTLIADLNKKLGSEAFKTDHKHSIQPIKLSSHQEKEAKPEETAYQPPKKRIPALTDNFWHVSFTQKRKVNLIKGRLR